MLDAGGYVIKLATKLLGENIEMLSCVMKDYDEFGVDMYGSYMFKMKRMKCFLGNSAWIVNTNVNYPSGAVRAS